MNRKLYLLLLLLCSQVLASAQVSISLDINGPLLQGGRFNPASWQIRIKSKEKLPKAYVRVQIQDQEGKVIYSVSSGVFSINAGVNQAVAGKWEKGEYDPETEKFIEAFKCLPMGSYLIRAQLFTGKPFPIAEAMQTWVQNESCLFSLLLLSPPNGAELPGPQPVLQWTIAGAPPAASKLQYRMRVYELLPGQSPAKAVLTNPVWLDITTGSTLQDLTALNRFLKEGQDYCWYVTAIWAKKEIARSEIWTFVYKKPVIPDDPPPSARVVYIAPVAGGQLPTYTLTDQQLHFFCIQERPDFKMLLEVWDGSGNRLAQRSLDTTLGYNYLSFPFKEIGLSNAIDGQLYRIMIRPSEGDEQSFFIRPQIKNP